MAPRKKMPDVMGELLSGNARHAGQQQDGLPVRQQTVMPAQQHSDEKVKATYYLSPQTLDALEVAKLKLRRLARKDKRAISNSAIVDAAIQIVCAELETGGSDSTIAGKLLRQ